MNNLELKSIEDLQDMSFFIPAYQRGYRWTTRQVEDLLDDIAEFINNGAKGIYCIQPLVVYKREGSDVIERIRQANDTDTIKRLLKGMWEVVDGQQRLTTIKLILYGLGTSSYTIEYETRQGSAEYLEQIQSDSINKDYESNIDYYHIWNAFQTIKRWLSQHQDIDITNVLSKQVKFIWYEINNVNTKEVFTRLNIGKISLTNAELVKALLLNKGNDIVDGIEEICVNLSQETLAGYLNQLKSADSPIKFYTLDMEDKNLPLSDDLYIKMNARGKVLTDFENFKVDLLNYKPDGETLLINEDGKTEDSFSHLLDTKWTDIFWYNRSPEHKIDDIFLKFLNRYFLNWFMAHYEDDGKLESVTGHNFYKALTEKNALGYKNISLYEKVLNKECIDTLYKCMNNLHALYIQTKERDGEENLSDKVNRLFTPYWKEISETSNKSPQFYFVPKYLEDGSISTITVQQRVAMHAVFIYLENCNVVQAETLQSWMHFVWNILENSYIDREQAVSAIRFFDQSLSSLSEDTSINMTDDIVGYLASIDENKLPGEIFGKKQLTEEILKAKKSHKDDEWKEKIGGAEKLYFFRGAIAFLFNDENGQPTAWDLFDKKLERTKQIFDANGLKEEYLIDTLQCLYSYCDSWDAQLWWSHKIFNGLAATWKENILTLVDRNYQYVYASPVHHILMGDEARTEISDERISALSNRSLIEYILKRNENKREMYIRWPYDALYFCGDKRGVLLSYSDRNKVIFDMLKNGRFRLNNEDIIIPGTNLYWGFDIDMIFQLEPEKDIHFRWYRESNNQAYDIYLMDDQWNYKHRPNEKPEEQGDRKNCYCFNVEKNLPNVVETIISKLKTEHEQSEKDSNT